MQNDNPSPRSLREAYYPIAIAIGVAIVNAGFGLIVNGAAYLIGRPGRLTDQHHTQADTDHIRAETQHLRLDIADTAIERFWVFYRKLDELTEQLDKAKYDLDTARLIANRVPELEARIEAQHLANANLSMMNERMKARLKIEGIEFPGPEFDRPYR